jgi:hypothetical protein
MEKKFRQTAIGHFSGVGEREVESVVSTPAPFKPGALLDRANEGECEASAAPVLSNRYKLLKTFKKGRCHLYFTDNTLTGQPEPLGWRTGRRQAPCISRHGPAQVAC